MSSLMRGLAAQPVSPDAQHAPDLVDAQWRLAVRHRGLLRALLAGADEFREERRYPARDVVDRQHGTRFFFHAHPGAFESRGEYGHFHVFLDPSREGGSSVTHLVAIAIDGLGLPVRLFCVNHWVTGDTWRPAGELMNRADNFSCATSGRLAPVARWLTAAVRAWAPTIDALLLARDQRVAFLRGQCKPLENVLQDHAQEVLAECRITLTPPSQSGIPS